MKIKYCISRNKIIINTPLNQTLAVFCERQLRDLQTHGRQKKIILTLKSKHKYDNNRIVLTTNSNRCKTSAIKIYLCSMFSYITIECSLILVTLQSNLVSLWSCIIFQEKYCNHKQGEPNIFRQIQRLVVSNYGRNTK